MRLLKKENEKADEEKGCYKVVSSFQIPAFQTWLPHESVMERVDLKKYYSTEDPDEENLVRGAIDSEACYPKHIATSKN